MLILHFLFTKIWTQEGFKNMKDKYGFKTFGSNGLQNYAGSNVVANAHRYLPKYKKPVTNGSVSDLFKETRTAAQKEEDKLKEQLRNLQNSKVSKDMLMSAEEKQLLSNANTLDQLFNSNRYAYVSSLDNATAKQIERNYSNKGAYFVNIDNTSVFFNKVSKIEKLDYVPGGVLKKSNYNYKYTTYNIYTKHVSGQDELKARVVFAN